MSDAVEVRPETIGETVDDIRAALTDYIEATYHISNERLVDQRRQLLLEPGVIYQVPYIESTPRYLQGQAFSELGLPKPALQLLTAMAHPDSGNRQLLYDPPYEHQARALTATLSEGRSLVVTTGTGSGKTESFLMPNSRQARSRGCREPSIICTVLASRNRAVSDEHARERPAGSLAPHARRPRSRLDVPGLGRTTSPLHRGTRVGPFTQEFERQRRTKTDCDRSASSTQTCFERHQAALRQSRHALAISSRSFSSRGKWPAKPDLIAWYGEPNSRWQRNGEYVRAVTLPNDPELLTRHEVLAAPPDVIVTNYSMLEYMLMRPLERPVFDTTREWLAEFPDERLLLVVDEAHLYRGAGGAEVGLLLRRLQRQRLGIPEDRLQVICTERELHRSECCTVLRRTADWQSRIWLPGNTGSPCPSRTRRIWNRRGQRMCWRICASISFSRPRATGRESRSSSPCSVISGLWSRTVSGARCMTHSRRSLR